MHVPLIIKRICIQREDTEDPFNLGIQSILKKPIKELTHLLKEMAISKDKEANKLVEKNEASKVEGPYKLIGASSVEKVDEKKGVKRPLGDGLKKGKSKRRKERRAREKKLEELRLENKRQKTPQLVENDIQLTKSIVPRKCRIKRYSFKYDTF
uniref:Uncharacterized protein n=1 Tax=Rhabditophanes sp. KR3021 TaxID=114890 RepID=A0AC35TXR5_9BILA